MLAAYLLIYIPVGLFVVAFLYETLLSFRRLKDVKRGRGGYVDATWEVTHTLLIFGVVMLFMLFTKAIDQLASAVFLSTLLAGLALATRAFFYIYIFYVRSPKARLGFADWAFALSHVAAALLLVVTVIQATWFLMTAQPPLNSQFVAPFMFGLVFVVGACIVPMLTIYRRP